MSKKEFTAGDWYAEKRSEAERIANAIAIIKEQLPDNAERTKVIAMLRERLEMALNVGD